MAKPFLERIKELMRSLGQWLKSHSGVVFTVIIAPIVVMFAGTLLLLYIGNPFAKPDITVNGDFGSGFQGRDVYPIVTVYNAGEATAKNCHVEVKDMQTQKGFWGPTIFSVSSDQKHFESLEFPAPKLPEGQTWDRRVYRIRAVCDNVVSPDSYTILKVY